MPIIVSLAWSWRYTRARANTRSSGTHPVPVTGFGSGGGAVTQQGEVLALIGASPTEGADCRTLVLAADQDDALMKAVETMDHFLPEAVLLLGQAEGHAILTVERVAINADDRKTPLRGGSAPMSESIDAAGPAGYFSTLPVQAMVDRMRAGGVPARISNTGGSGPCNRLFYALLHYVALRGRETWFKRRPPAGLVSRVGLLRVPPTPRTNALARREAPSLAPEISVRGVSLAVGAIVDF